MLTSKKKLSIGVLFLLMAIGVFLYGNAKRPNQQNNLQSYASISSICELTTLKSFYHNVVTYQKTPNGFESFVNDIILWPFGKNVKLGQGQFWIEYSGIVETGIDATKVKIGNANADGIVDVYIPDAIVINVYADENSLTSPMQDTGIFTDISGNEKIAAFAAAQRAMRQEAENDSALLNKAKENTKVILERYIVFAGREMGKELSVRWVDAP